MPTKTTSNKDRLPYAIQNAGEDEVEILIYDVIGQTWDGEGVVAKQFVKDLKAAGRPKSISIRINSPGGNVFDSLAIYNALKQHKATVRVTIDGLAASGASVIAMAGDEIVMRTGALMMVHNPSGMAYGESKDLRKYADILDKTRDSIVEAYVDRSGMSDTDVSALLDDETWMDADEAVAYGFADNVSEEDVALAAHYSIDDFPQALRVPRKLKRRVQEIVNIQTETTDMSDVNEPAKVAATIAQLKALKGADSDFVVAQLERGATYDEAIVALNDSLYTQLQEAVAARDAAMASAAAEPSQPQAAAETQPGAEAKRHQGVAPVTSAKPAAETGGKSVAAWGDDPAGFYRRELRRIANECGNNLDAVKQMKELYPGLSEAIQDSVNSAAA